MNIVLIRHGMTQGNIDKKYIGCRTDQPLSDIGVEKLKDIVYPSVDSIYVSPMKRCVQTANTIFNNRETTVVDDFREIDFGIFENKNHNELNGNKDYQAWIDSDGLGAIPDGESFEEFTIRTTKAFNSIVEKDNSDTIAIVAHGGTIMALLYSLGGYNYFDTIVDNGRGYICQWENNSLRILEKI